jgi:WD40 repeat protein
MAAFRARIIVLTFLLLPTGLAEGAQLPEPKADGQKPKTDLYGDPLPAGAVARFGPLRLCETRHVHSVAFAPDGRLIASSGWEGRIHLWDARTGTLIRTLPSRLENTAGTNSIPCVVFGPDGKCLLSGHRDGSTRMWDTASGKELWRSDVKSHGGVNAVAYAPDGKVVASSHTGSPTRIWDAKTGNELLRLEEDSTSSLSLVFSADSKMLISGEPFRVRMWELKAPKVRRTFGTFQNWVRSVALSPDGKLLAAGSNYPNNGMLSVWEVESGKELLSRIGPHVNSVAFTPDGKTLVSAGMGISTWEVGAWKQRQPEFAPSSQMSPAVAISPDGRTLAGGMWSGAIQLWDLGTGKKIPYERGHLLSVSALEVTPDGKTLASWGHDQTLILWDLATGKEIVRRGKANSVVLNWNDYEVGISKDGRLLATLDTPHCIRLTELRTGNELGRLNHEGKVVYRVALAPDGKSLASVTDDSLWLWDPIARVIKHRIALENLQRVGPLHFSSDGKLLSLGRRLWHVETRRELRRFDEPRDGLDEVLFSPDGRKLATANYYEQFIQFWEVASGREIHRLSWKAALEPIRGETNRERATALAFAPDGRTLAASCTDGTIRFWNVGSGQEHPRLDGEQGYVSSLVFTLDGQRLATGGEDGTILLWEVPRLDKSDPGTNKELGLEELKTFWRDLAGDPGPANRAVDRLIESPHQALALLQEHLRPITKNDAQITQWIRDLDNDSYEVREKAGQELLLLGPLAETALREALAAMPSAEVRRRARALLNQIDGPIKAPDELRRLRALEVLERIATPDARQILKQLASGAKDARLTREAKASLERLERR